MKQLRLSLFLALVCIPAGARQGPDSSAIDRSADPCQDFYQYACGGWMKSHPIPSDESAWGRFDELALRNEAILREVLEDSAKNRTRSQTDQKIGTLYQSCMDEEKIEQLGASPLKPELDRIARVNTPRELLDEVAHLHRMQVGVFFRFYPLADRKDARMMIAELDQGGLGLPERDFYFRADPKSAELRGEYVQTMAKMFGLAGVPKAEAEKKASAVLSIETDLARASLDVTTRRDPQKRFHEMPLADAAKLSPNFDLEGFFKEVETPAALTIINVSVPDFVKAFSSLVSARTMSELRDYMTWHYLHASAPYLSKGFVDENFSFYDRALYGQKEQKPRWRRCVGVTDSELGEALGRRYVDKTFGEEGKQRTLAMVKEIETEMEKDLESLTWMSAATKKKALLKLQAVTNKIGYPDQWRDYSSVEIVDGDYFGNIWRVNQFDFRRAVDKMGKPVNRGEWLMTPPTVNAYFQPSQNNINFPAGILQPPFFSNQNDDAVNYGAIGTIVGHELTHAFDDSGRQYDADGNLKDWWQPEDAERFRALAKCTVNQYGSYSPISGVELNGQLTLGENTADNGGARLAYMALMNDLASKTISPSEKTGGYTQAQQFFLAFAQNWCENLTPEAARLQVQTGPHSPGRFRANGVVKNMPEFSQVFACKPADKMYVAQGKGCQVW